MKIRKARKNDFKKIAKLMLDEFGKPPFNEKASTKDVLKTLNFYNKIGKIMVLELNKKIVGASVFKIEQYWEGKVIIIEDLLMKKSIDDNKLIKSIEDFAKKKKINKIYFATNKKSPSLNKYKKIGYKEEKQTIFMYKKIK